MKQQRRRKCLHCRELFRSDPRNLRHQRYCSKRACRQASKAASQRRWLGKAQNRNYFLGAINVQRVRAWRAAHPGYWKRTGPQTGIALQDVSGCITPRIYGEPITAVKTGTTEGAATSSFLFAQAI